MDEFLEESGQSRGAAEAFLGFAIALIGLAALCVA